MEPHARAGFLRRNAVRVGLAVVGGTLIGAGTLFAAGHHPSRAKETLTATSAAPDARGKLKFIFKNSSHAKMKVNASKLAGGKSYDLLVGGVKVGTIATSTGGSGKASFSAVPGAHDSLLGFDPRGASVTVRDEDDGDDVLVGDVQSDDPAAVACCLSQDDDEGEVECEDLTADECTAEGGVVQTVDSCLPNPCATNPPEGEELVCCINATHDDENEAECEDVGTEGECAALGGMIVAAASCDDDPCNGAPPVDRTACCVPDDDGASELDCEVLSAAACAARNGMPAGTAAATCSGDPCGGGDEDGDPGED